MTSLLDEGWTVAVADGRRWESEPQPCKPGSTHTWDLGKLSEDLRIDRYVLRWRGREWRLGLVDNVQWMCADESTYSYTLILKSDAFRVALGDWVLDGSIPVPA